MKYFYKKRKCILIGNGRIFVFIFIAAGRSQTHGRETGIERRRGRRRFIRILYVRRMGHTRSTRGKVSRSHIRYYSHNYELNTM